MDLNKEQEIILGNIYCSDAMPDYWPTGKKKISSKGLHVALRIGCDVLMVLFSSSKLFNHNYTMKKFQR